MDHHANAQQKAENTISPRVKVWDLPTRIFHWLLVILVIISFVTGNLGGNAMQYHVLSGLTIFVLLIFRVAWGFAGGQQSRFTAFVRGPTAVIRYAKGLVKGDSPRTLGHNPLGGWSIIAMLLTLGAQVATGLFANDDILTQGPLYGWVSKAASDWLTRIHKFNSGVIVGLVTLHVLAVVFYFFGKGDNLVAPMITGIKPWRGSATEPTTGSVWTAAIIAGLSLLAVTLLVNYGG